MNGNKWKRLIILLILLLSGLWVINHNILHYEEVFLVGRTFDSETDTKSDYLLTSNLPLKKGVYHLSINGFNQGKNNSWFILVNGEKRFIESCPINEEWIWKDFTIEEPVENVQIGVSYDKEDAPFEIKRISIATNNTLYRENLTRCLTISLFAILLFILLTLRFVFYPTYQRVFRQISSPASERILLFLILLTILISYPFYQPDYIKGDDSTFHIARIEGIKESLLEGQIPPRIHLFFLNDYGYATGLFYPDFFLWFPAVLRILGFDFITTYKIFIFCINLLTALITYFGIKQISKSRYAGICGTILYVLALYRLIDVYDRGAVGEILAMTFLPLIIAGLSQVLSGNISYWPELALGCICVGLSHVITPVLAAFCILLCCVLNARTILQNKQILISLLKAAGATALIAGFFWAPMIEQMLTGDVILTNRAAPIMDPGVPISHLLSNKTVWEVPVQPCIGMIFSLLIFLRFFFHPKDKKIKWFVDCALIISMTVIFLSSDLFPWKLFPIIHQMIQFPWRFLTIATVTLSMGEAVLVDSVIKPPWRTPMIIALFIWCLFSANPTLRTASVDRKIERDGYRLQTNRIGNGEYLPTGADKEFIDKNRNTVLTDNTVLITNTNRKGLSFQFEFSTEEESAAYYVPMLYYKGYAAVLETDGGETLPLTPEHGENGLIRLKTQNINHGVIRVYYKGTLIQKISDIVSLTALLLIPAAIFLSKRKRLTHEMV